MAIKLPCPRCKKPLAVPNKKAGTYVNCPLCQGRLWVPKDSQADAAHLDEVVVHAQSATPAAPEAPIAAGGNPPPLPPSASPATLAKVLTPPGANAPVAATPLAGAVAAPPVTGPGSPAARAGVGTGPAATWTASSVQPSAAVAAPGAPPQPPPVVAQPGTARPLQAPKAPRFISAEAALSRLQLSSDGRLPQLHLHESTDEPKQKQQSRSVNPLLLLVVLGASVLVSILMVLLDSGGQSAQQARSVEEAWQIIEGEYFGDPDKPQRPQRYQELLRDAQRARNRGDLESQNRLLREVLAMLDAEPHPNDRGRGLTGSPGRDKRLREQIIVLLREK